MVKVTIYRWAKDRGVRPQVAYSWRDRGLPTDERGKVDPAEADAWLAHRRRHAHRQRGSAAPAAGQTGWTLADLAARETESIIRGLASLAFLRAQGRTLARGSQELFIEFIWHEVAPRLGAISDRASFDLAHSAWVRRLQDRLRTSRATQLGYGQAQKSLNVFLKFYVDWASRPDPSTASRLRPWLHCPLDKVVMWNLANLQPAEYKRRLAPLYRTVPHQQRYSLSTMSRHAYEAWQQWIRDLSPEKPVLVDVLWVFERKPPWPSAA